MERLSSANVSLDALVETSDGAAPQKSSIVSEIQQVIVDCDVGNYSKCTWTAARRGASSEFC